MSDIGVCRMSQTLMDHYQDYAGLAPHETVLAREFHLLIVKQRISELQSQIDTLSKDENVHALSHHFQQSEYHFKLYHFAFVSGLLLFAVYFFATFINF